MKLEVVFIMIFFVLSTVNAAPFNPPENKSYFLDALEAIDQSKTRHWDDEWNPIEEDGFHRHGTYNADAIDENRYRVGLG
ncbi:hypothetical protein L596_026259 [Steinernema carpocapsae]|nr:hypothetical protein L596_026259 [Steinernema carpocapsae]